MHYKNEVSYITVDPNATASFQTMNYSLDFTIFDELFANFHVYKKKVVYQYSGWKHKLV